MADKQRFEAIVTEETRSRLLAYCRRFAGNDAEDACQEALLLAYRRFARYDETKPLMPWLICIAANQYRSHQRTSGYQISRNSMPLLIDELGQRDPLGVDPAALLFPRVSRDHEMELIEQAIEQLSPAYRDVMLQYLAGTERQDAQTLERLKRARQHIRRIIADAQRDCV